MDKRRDQPERQEGQRPQEALRPFAQARPGAELGEQRAHAGQCRPEVERHQEHQGGRRLTVPSEPGQPEPGQRGPSLSPVDLGGAHGRPPFYADVRHLHYQRFAVA